MMPFSILSLLWWTMVILVNPIGHFPLNDDWAYGRIVKIFLEEGRWQLVGPVNVPFLSQGLWGALFSWPFGFSFTALRFSTLTLGWLGVLATYGLLREIGARRRLALMGALVIATNPIYFALSHTFMTDIPFFTFATLSIFCLIRGVNRDRFILILIGSFLASLATLTRQMGIVIPLSFGIGYLVKEGFKREIVKRVALHLIIGIGPLFLYHLWLSMSQGGYPLSYQHRINNWFLVLIGNIVDHTLLQTISYNFMTASIYLGLFLIPFLWMVWTGERGSFSRGNLVSAFFAIAIFFGMAVFLIATKTWMPLSYNILFEGGIGPVTLKDVHVLKLEHIPKAPQAFWVALTAAGVAGSALLIFYIISSACTLWSRRDKKFLKEGWQKMLFLSASFFCFVLYIPTWFFDRYLLFCLPLLMGAVFSGKKTASMRLGRFSLLIVVALLTFWAIFSVVTTHDYLSWNRARWEALRHLTEEEGISPKEIDGGYEFNGWFGYRYNFRHKRGKSWWWVEDDVYVVSFGPIPGYREIGRYLYSRWFPPSGKGHILILRRL